MTDYSDAVYGADRLRLISQYTNNPNSLSPTGRQMAEYLIKNSGRLPQDMSVVARPVAQYSTTSLMPFASSLMNPSVLVGALGTLGTLGVLKGAKEATPQDWKNAELSARFGFPVGR